LPELPEVETVVRTVAPHLVGRRIVSTHLTSHRVTRGDVEETERALTGATIQAIRRRGKQILIDLDRGLLYVHLGMTGKLLWKGEPGKYTRGYIELDTGCLVYDDVRQFGRLEFYGKSPDALERVGPDALSVDFELFYERLRKRRGHLKAILLNQRFLAGLGNIYADELLFAARVHPRTRTDRISRQRAKEIHKHMLEILALAIAHRGSSVSDYVDSSGERGSFQQLHNVYGREGEPCPRCGTAIRRTVIAQRGTHYCPRCQRA